MIVYNNSLIPSAFDIGDNAKRQIVASGSTELTHGDTNMYIDISAPILGGAIPRYVSFSLTNTGVSMSGTNMSSGNVWIGAYYGDGEYTEIVAANTFYRESSSLPKSSEVVYELPASDKEFAYTYLEIYDDISFDYAVDLMLADAKRVVSYKAEFWYTFDDIIETVANVSGGGCV